MPTAFANAANRAGALSEEPIIVAPLVWVSPVDSRYLRVIAPVSATDPAKARPMPSRIDLRARSRTDAGISAERVLTMNAPTYAVAAGCLASAAAAFGT